MTLLLDVLRLDPDEPPSCRVGEMVDVAVPTVVATTLLVVMTDEKVDEPDTETTVVTYCWVAEDTMAEVITVDFESVERLIVDAALPDPMTTMSDAVPVAVLTARPVEVT